MPILSIREERGRRCTMDTGFWVNYGWYQSKSLSHRPYLTCHHDFKNLLCKTRSPFQPTQKNFVKHLLAFFVFVMVSLALVCADKGYIPFWPDFLEPNGIKLRYGVNRHFDEFGTTNCASVKFQSKCTYNPYFN
jgi:hypothetical protein